MIEQNNILNQQITTANNPLRFIISGGGTGGHIFPAIAIANALKAQQPSCEILFVGAEGRMEMEKVPVAGYAIVGLPVAGFKRKEFWKNGAVIVKLLKSLSKAGRIIKEFNPDAVIGVGGYASGPVLWKASQKKIPVFIQEQNSFAGVTNKLLAKRAKRIFVAYDGMDKFFPSDKIVLAGNPVRQDIASLEEKKDEAISYFKLDKSKKTILSIGGSLGARTLNDCIKRAINVIENSNVQLIWQTGGYYYKEMQNILNQHSVSNIHLFDFIKPMDLAYAAADVVISRSGALSISELCLAAKPAILVPSPNVAEDHQTRNAMALVNNEAALIVYDAEAQKNLIEKTICLVQDEVQCEKLSENIGKMALRDSASRIADMILYTVLQ